MIVRDAGVELRPDLRRIVPDLFLPGERTPGSTSRAEGVVGRVRALPRAQVESAARRLGTGAGGERGALSSMLHANADKVDRDIRDPARRLVLGAAFTAERAVEGIAVCNPSAVAHPDQRAAPEGGLRVIVSLRSVSEGGTSAISFCTALIGPGREWTFEERALPVVRAEIVQGEWDLDHLHRALESDGRVAEISHAVLRQLPARVGGEDIERAIGGLPPEFFTHVGSREQLETIRRIGRSAYVAAFAPDSELGQRVLLPAADEEWRGMEDARFVRFVDDAGDIDYRASYTAYDGSVIASRLIRTPDFERFSIHRLTGAGTMTKGIAFFPRRVGGRFLALTRSDGESIALARSDDGLDWGDEVPVLAPSQLWEIVQLGNCGAPIETDHGWLVVTHGVGPMRRYSLGAILLDLEDAARVIARLQTPLLEPSGVLREGCVPNVVYSCGGIVHDGVLWLPYGVGDGYVRVASVGVAELIAAMTPVSVSP